MMIKAMGLAVLMALPGAVATAQEPDRRDLERRLAEALEQVRDLERQMRGDRMSSASPRFEKSLRHDRPRISAFIAGRPRLGVVVRSTARPATDSIGAALQAVSPGGPAAQAGLKAGDIIVSFNGERLAGRSRGGEPDESQPGQRLIELAHELDEGDSVKVVYRRGGETLTATIVAQVVGAEGFAFGLSGDSNPFRLERLEIKERFPELDFRVELPGPWLDMELTTLNPDLGEYFGTTDGLLVVSAPRADGLGLKSGDVILGVDGRTPASPSQAMRILRSYEEGDPVQFQVLRQKKRISVTGKVPASDRVFMRERHPEQ